MNTTWRDRLLAYDEPDLDPTERTALDALLDEEPEARAFLNQIRRDRALFQESFGSVKARDGFVDGVLDRLPGRRRARFGLPFPMPRVMELAAAAMMLLVGGSLFSPRSTSERQRAEVCQQQVKDLTQVVMNYAADYDGHLPAPDRLGAQVVAYGQPAGSLLCPSDERPNGPSYAMPLAIAGAPVNQFATPASQPLLFDARGPFLVPRHDRAANVSFLDGSVRQITLDAPGRPAGW